jgi:hypothetical protein
VPEGQCLKRTLIFSPFLIKQKGLAFAAMERRISMIFMFPIFVGENTNKGSMLFNGLSR